MRTALALVFCVLIAAGVATADEKTTALSKAEREAALKQAAEAAQQAEHHLARYEYPEAVARRSEALALHERVLGPDHVEVADDLIGLARVLTEISRLDGVDALLARGMGILERSFGAEHARLLLPLAVRAAFLRKRMDYAGAWQDLERARHILEGAPEATDEARAVVLQMLGNGYLANCHYHTARELLERAVLLREASPSADPARLARNYGDIGSVLLQQRQYDAVRVLGRRLQQVGAEVFGDGHFILGYALNALSEAERRSGHPLEARAHAQEALAIYERWSLRKGTAYSLRMRAMADHALGEHAAALEGLAPARAMAHAVFGPDSPYYALVLKDMAPVLSALGRNAEARKTLEEALAIGLRVLDDDNIYMAEAHADLARICLAQGDTEAALEQMQLCFDASERAIRRDLIAVQGPERLLRVREVYRHLGTWLELAPQLGRDGYAEVLHFKGFVARVEAAERRLWRRAGRTAAGARQIAALQAAERELARVAMIRRAVSSSPRRDQASRAALDEMRAEAQAKRDRLARELGKALEVRDEGDARLALGPGDVQRYIPPGAVLVDVLRCEGRYDAWVVPAKGAVVRVALGAAGPIDDAAFEFANETEKAESLDDEAWLAAGHALRALVVPPIEAHLGRDVTTLILAPDGALATVPFAALPGKRPGDFLLDDYTLQLVTSAQDLVPWTDAPKRGTGALLVGGVDYDRAAAAPETVKLVARAPQGVSLSRKSPGLWKFVPLESTGAEVEHLRGRLGGAAVLLRGPNATEARVRTEARGKRILHFATHGDVDTDVRSRARTPGVPWRGIATELQLAVGSDPLLLAGLAFAGATKRKGAHGDDGILTALEASRLDLEGVELVVLSACKTALGRVESGEGVIGLVQGIQMAGAQHVIATLWSVDDAATPLLIERFYEGVLREKDPLPPAAALRRAARWMRDEARRSDGTRYAGPAYWAAFVAYGF